MKKQDPRVKPAGDGCGIDSDMKVLCTNGLKSVLLELAPAFERKSGMRLAITWGSTIGLAKDIEGGAGADLAVLTAEAIDALIERGRVVAGSRVDLARSGIGLAVRQGASKPDIGSPEALRSALLAARSVAHSKTGQSGPRSRASVCMRSTTSRPDARSSDAVGSSASTSSAPTSARAIATRWRWPPDNCPGRLCARSPIPTASHRAARAVHAPRPSRTRRPSSTFCDAVNAPSRLCCWKMKPTCFLTFSS